MQKKGSLNILIILEIVIFVVLCVLVVLAATKSKKKGEATTQDEVLVSATSWMTELTETVETETEATTEEVLKADVDTFSETVQDVLDGMSAEEKAAQLFAVSPEGLTGQDEVTVAGDATRAAMEDYPVGGLVYTYTNYSDEEQASDLLTGSYDMAAGVMDAAPLMIATDDGESAPYSIAYAKGSVLSELVAALGEESGVTELEETDDTGLLLNYTVAAVPAEFAEQVKTAGILIWNGTYDDQTVAKFRIDYDYHGVIMLSASGDEAVSAIADGMDMIYLPDDFEESYTAVLDAINSGDITEERLNQAVGHILSFKLDEALAGETPDDENDEADGQDADADDGNSGNSDAATTETSGNNNSNNNSNRNTGRTTQAVTTQSTTQAQQATTQTTTQTPATTQTHTTAATTQAQPVSTAEPIEIVTTEQPAPSTTAAPAPEPSVGDGDSMDE
jgi:hypothetical protein